MGVKQNRKHRADDAAVKSAAGLKSGDAENFARIRHVVVPGAQDQPELRHQQSHQDKINSQVPELIGINARAWRLSAAIPQADQHAGGNQHAVGVNRDAAKCEEYRMHAYAGSRLGCACSRNSSNTTSAAPSTIAESATLKVYQ